jgi:hypothetical protein
MTTLPENMTPRKIAHDLNNAVGTIWLNLHSLKKKYSKLPDPDPEILAIIQSVESETRTIAALAAKISTIGTEQSRAESPSQINSDPTH